MKGLVLPVRLRRGSYLARLLVLLPALLGLVYAQLGTLQSKGPNIWIAVLLVGTLLALTIAARMTDAGFPKLAGTAFILVLALVFLMQMLVMTRLDWVQARALTRTPWQLMVPECIGAFAVLTALALIAAPLPSEKGASDNPQANTK